MKTAVCLQHVPFEGPAFFGKDLVERGYRIASRIVPQAGLPKDGGDLLVVMGGPMSVNDDDAWIAAETKFIREHVEGGRPYLGVCLGSQFLAKAMGGRVYKGPQPEIGMTAIDVTPAGRSDAAFRGAESPMRVFEWHGEGIEAPPGAVTLASSPLYPVQAFRCGAKAYGLLFHIEIEPEGAGALCRECGDDVARANANADQVVAGLHPHIPQLQRQARRVLDALTA